MSIGVKSTSETKGFINYGIAIDEGQVTTKIAQMPSPARDKLQIEIRESWPTTSVTGAITKPGFTHYFAPLGFLVKRWYT